MVLVPEAAVDVGDAVHGVCGAHGVVQFLKRREGLLAPGKGLPVVTELGMKPADTVEHESWRSDESPGEAVAAA